MGKEEEPLLLFILINHNWKMFERNILNERDNE
jgi:hypothetical protein